MCARWGGVSPPAVNKIDNFIFKWCNLAHFKGLIYKCVLGHEVCWGVLMNFQFRGSLGCLCVGGGGVRTHPVHPLATGLGCVIG